MRLIPSAETEGQSTGQPRRRKGGILFVVLARLTLFEIVGVTFHTYAESVKAPALREPYSDDTHDLAFHSLALAKKIHPFLVNVIQDDPDDVEGVYSALRGFEDRVDSLRTRVRLALAEEEDARIRE